MNDEPGFARFCAEVYPRLVAHRQRECLVLRHYLGFTAEETGRMLGISQGAVRALTHRAVSGLRQSLAEESSVEGTNRGV